MNTKQHTKLHTKRTNRVKRNSNKSRKLRKQKGGGFISNILKSNGIEMPDEKSQNLFGSAISIIEENPFTATKFGLKFAKIYVIFNKKCNIDSDNIEQFKCGLNIASKIITPNDEKELKKLLSRFITQNHSKIQEVLEKYDIHGIDLSNPNKFINEFSLSNINKILSDD